MLVVEVRLMWNREGMNHRHVAVGAASLFSFGALLWLPMNSRAVQSLVEQGSAVGVAGSLNSRATSNLGGAVGKARSLKSVADKQNKENKVWEDDGGVKPGKKPVEESAPKETIYDASSLLQLQTKEQFEAAKGKVLAMAGTVELVLHPTKNSNVLIVAPDSRHKFPDTARFYIRLAKTDKVPKEGDAIAVKGVYESFFRDEKANRSTVIMNNGQVIDPEMAPPAGESAPNQAAPAAEKVEAKFESPLGGWHFEGTAEMETGTAVFVSPEGRPSFVKVGETIMPGCRLTKIESGRVEIDQSGKKLDIIVW